MHCAVVLHESLSNRASHLLLTVFQRIRAAKRGNAEFGILTATLRSESIVLPNAACRQKISITLSNGYHFEPTAMTVGYCALDHALS